MKRRLVVLLSFALVMFAFAPAAMAGHGNGAPNGNHTASLKAQNEVQMPAVESDAAGQAVFKFRNGALSFKLIVANIDNVLAAHIHCAPAGENGPVGVTLFSGGPVTTNGILSQGAITAPDPGNGCGWSSLADVFSAIESGDTYVNVHTPAFPAGEIRGQIR